MDTPRPDFVTSFLRRFDIVSVRVATLGTRSRHWLAFLGPRRIVGAVAGAAVVGAAGWWLLRPPAAPVEVLIPVVSSTSVAQTQATVGSSAVRVHVAGAVRRPGVYTLDAGARVVDAVRAAGGATDSADLERINLAQTILDTEQVVVPRRSSSRSAVTVAPRHRPSRRTTTTAPVVGAPGVSPPTQPTAGAGIVNLNTASVEQLDTLPGVGPATAKAIVAYRTRKGPFTRLEDLLAIDGIGPKKLEALRDAVSL